jgi:putative sugar O-methyltransferase
MKIHNIFKASLRRIFYRIRTYQAFRANPLADLSLLGKGLAPVPNQIDEDRHKLIVGRIAQAYSKAKPLQADVPTQYLPAEGWEKDIRTRRAGYLEALNSGDLSALGELLQNFFRNNGMAGLTVFAYFSDIQNANSQTIKQFVNDMLSDYSSWNDLLDSAKINDICVPPIGNPWGYVIEGSLLMPNSLRHHYYGTHVENLLKGIESPIVAEIGGGYGGFANSWLSVTNGGKYLDFDLPEILLMASYYLMCAFPDKRFLLFGESENNGPVTPELINEYDVILLPNFRLPDLASNSVDLFINTNSLSEMDYDTVAEYVSQIVRSSKRYFFHVNSDRQVPKGFGGIEVASSQFPISADIFQRIYKSNSAWGGGSGRYREHLYQRISDQSDSGVKS